MQDINHIGVKLKTRLLKPNIVLPLGNYAAASDHLSELVSKYPKNLHFLTSAVLNHNHKMNFKSVQLIISNDVIRCLSHVKNSLGTQLYLTLIQEVLDSYLHRNLSALDRVYKIWHAVFFLRIWRKWIKTSSEFTLTDNFITLNTYTGIEIDAHTMLILIARYIKENRLQDFTPWYLGSQANEEWFRAARSLTSTFSTIINFTAKEFVEKSKKIEFLYENMFGLTEEFNFPRMKKSENKQIDENSLKLEDFITKIMEAKENAITDTKMLGMNVQENSWAECDINSTDDIEKQKDQEQF